MTEGRLTGRSILVLEDEYLIAMDVEQTCLEWGAEKVTIVRSVDALSDEHLADGAYDAAVLDLRLGGQSTVGVAERLEGIGIPFVFATGMSDIDELTQRFAKVPVVAKPYSCDDLVRILLVRMNQSLSGCSA